MTRDLGFDVTAGLDTVRDHMADLSAIGTGAWSWYALSRRGTSRNGDATRITNAFDRFGSRAALPSGTLAPKVYSGFPTGADFSENNPTIVGASFGSITVSDNFAATGWAAALVYTRSTFAGLGDTLLNLGSGERSNLQIRSGVIQSYGASSSIIGPSVPVGKLTWAIWGFNPAGGEMTITTPDGTVTTATTVPATLSNIVLGGAGGSITRSTINDLMITNDALSSGELTALRQVIFNLYGI